jgi:hypothetical protein
MNWADYWGTFTLPAEQVAELLSEGGLLRIPGSSGFPFGSGGDIQGVISLVPEPSSLVLFVGGLLWLTRFKGGRVAEQQRGDAPTERPSRHFRIRTPSEAAHR